MNGGGRPAMTPAEIRAGLRDEGDGAHWAHGRCWCSDWHAGEPVAVMVAPPWDPSRNPMSSPALLRR